MNLRANACAEQQNSSEDTAALTTVQREIAGEEDRRSARKRETIETEQRTLTLNDSPATRAGTSPSDLVVGCVRRGDDPSSRDMTHSTWVTNSSFPQCLIRRL